METAKSRRCVQPGHRNKKKETDLRLEQLPHLQHRPHKIFTVRRHAAHPYDCHQFEIFNLIEIEWTNDEDDDDDEAPR